MLQIDFRVKLQSTDNDKNGSFSLGECFAFSSLFHFFSLSISFSGILIIDAYPKQTLIHHHIGRRFLGKTTKPAKYKIKEREKEKNPGQIFSFDFCLQERMTKLNQGLRAKEQN